MEKLVWSINRIFSSIFILSETQKSQLICKSLKVGLFSSKIKNYYSLYRNSQQLHGVMQKVNEKLEFVQSGNFYVMDSLKNSGLN